MSQASQLSPELARGVLQLARALGAAARTWTLYPPEHPSVGASVTRLRDAIRQSSLGSAFGLGVTPTSLLVEGVSAGDDTSLAETAKLLHERDLLEILFVGDVTPEALRAFLRLLAMDPDERRRRGGPAAIWTTEGHPSLRLTQIDYQGLLTREPAVVAEQARRDDLWRAIVVAISGGEKTIFDERAQQRLLAIAGSAVDIADLSTAVMAPKCTIDGSPMITSQAAVVLATFRHLSSIVSVMAPDRMPEVLGNIAQATSQLDPHVVMQVLQTEEDPHEPLQVVRGLAGAFDDVKVAQLLATALAIDGQASDRLATIFNTIAPDAERKQRVLTLTRSLLSETDFGQTERFQSLWTSMEELLVSYDDKPFMSDTYRTALDNVGGRAEQMAVGGDVPPELPEWMETLGQESVRRLSVVMLIDLLTIERDAARAEELAYDLQALAEDLLMSGAYEDAATVVKALGDRASSGLIGSHGARHALERLGESVAMQETALLIGDLDDGAWHVVRGIMRTAGVSAVEALKAALVSEEESAGTRRAADLVVEFGSPAVGRLASFVADTRWFVQRTGARLLGRIGSAAAVPLLQPLLRRSDPRVAREVVSALSGIDDPSAARAIHTVLRSATGELRRAVIDALVADRDPRVVPMLARILDESRPLGDDHEVVLETIDAIGSVGHETGVPALASVIRRRGLLRRRRLRALKQHGVWALGRIAAPAASATLDEAARTGDWMLRKIVRSKHGD